LIGSVYSGVTPLLRKAGSQTTMNAMPSRPPSRHHFPSSHRFSQIRSECLVALAPDFPLGVELEVFVRREDAER
jgi:hypothetical protein